MKRRAPTAYQMPETLSISKTFKVPGNCHRLQDPSALQTTHKILIRNFPIHSNRPTLDLPRNKIEENRDRLSKSLPNLEI